MAVPGQGMHLRTFLGLKTGQYSNVQASKQIGGQMYGQIDQERGWERGPGRERAWTGNASQSILGFEYRGILIAGGRFQWL